MHKTLKAMHFTSTLNKSYEAQRKRFSKNPQ